jgi:membrane-associated phospholipid phosphatase
MENLPVRRPYFSAVAGREKLLLALCWVVTVLFALILTFFWEQTRSLEFIVSLQPFRSAPVEMLFRVFTFLGDDQFFMIFFSVLLWCVSKPLGFWTVVMLLTSGTYSGLLKDITVLERPALEGIVHPDNHAFPSGHTLTAVTVWGYMAVRLRSRAFWIWAGVAVLMIGVSRLVLGYHFLGDVLGGVAFGLPFLLFFLWLSAMFTEQGWADKWSLPLMLAIALLAPLAAGMLLPGNDPPKLMGYLAGAGVGYLLDKEYLRFRVAAPLWQQVVKSVLGLAVLFGIIMGLSPLLPSSVPILGFIRYGLGGLWGTFLAPALFVGLRLSRRESAEQAAV